METNNKEGFKIANKIFKKLGDAYEYEYKREISKIAKRGQKGKIERLCRMLVKRSKEQSFDLHTSLIQSAEKRLAETFEEIFPFRTSKNRNFFRVRFSKSTNLLHEKQRRNDLYANSYRFPGVDHVFTLYLKVGEKFKVEGSELIVYGKDKLTAFVQYRGLNIKRKDIEMDKVWVTQSDSIKAGNCAIGTEHFVHTTEMANSWGKIGALRADFLLKLLDNKHTKRAIQYAHTHKKIEA